MSKIGTNRPLKLALIGCGEHSRENLVPSLSQLHDVKVAIACDVDRAAANEVAIRMGGCDVEIDFEHALNRDDLNAIVVAATPQVHYRVAHEALRRGLHIFVEKPPTVTRTELKKLAIGAQKRGLVTGVGHNLRHATAAIEMQSILKGKESGTSREELFGCPIAMEMRYFASKPRGDRWSLNSPLRSFLLSHANHAIDFMIYQMGKIRRVNAALASGNQEGIALSVQFVFSSGAVGNLLATSFAPHFTISGTIVSDRNRVVHLNSLNEVIAYGLGDDKKRWGRCWGSKTLLTGYEAAGYLTELQNFIDAIRENRPEKCHPSFADELAIYDVMDEIEKILGRNTHTSV